MISENSVKTQFIVDALTHQTDILYKRLFERFHSRLHSESGTTLTQLAE